MRAGDELALWVIEMFKPCSTLPGPSVVLSIVLFTITPVFQTVSASI